MYISLNLISKILYILKHEGLFQKGVVISRGLGTMNGARGLVYSHF